MKSPQSELVSPRAALLTAAIPAAVATISVTGTGSLAAVAQCFRTRGTAPATGGSAARLAHETLATMAIDAARFGMWVFAAHDLPSEHVVLSRTGHEAFEIHCHGGTAVCAAILEELRRGGQCEIVPAENASLPMGDWSEGSKPLLEQQAETALCQASTLKVAAILLAQWHGALRRDLNRLLSLIHANQRAAALGECRQLLARGHWGLRLLDPPRLTLGGPPNVGKSSLVNQLVGSQRVLVHDQPGTTRDAIDTLLVAAGWPMMLTDTAGMRDTSEEIESQGVHIAARRWRDADIGLLVVDATIGWTQTHEQLLAERSQDTLVVLNKCDLVPEAQLFSAVSERIHGLRDGTARVVRADARVPSGVQELLDVLGQHFDSVMPKGDIGVPFLAAQVAILQHVHEWLLTHHESATESTHASDLIQQLLD